MALQRNYYYQPFDTSFGNAYWRINPNTGIQGGKNKITYTMQVFKDRNSADSEDSKYIAEYHYNFIPDMSFGAANFVMQAYNHFKSLPEFMDAIDI